jgi:hypothetical protein
MGAGTVTTVNWTSFNPQGGGVEFFGLLPGGLPNTPPNSFSVIGWGCNDSDVTSCAAYSLGAPAEGSWPLDPNTAILATTATDPRTNAMQARSALSVTGLTGMLDDATWHDITSVTHYNHVIFGDALSSAQVHGVLQINGSVVDIGGISTTNVDFTETPNGSPCQLSPVPNSPVNPLGTTCDDFAIVSGLDLAPIPVPNSNNLGVKFQLAVPPPPPPPAVNLALVCPNPDPAVEADPAKCNGYADPKNLLIYTGENSNNTFTIQAQLFTITPQNPLPLFVIGDCHWDQSKPHTGPGPGETNLRAVNEIVNFWGSQWWKNNCMHDENDNGYPSFKGYATNAVVDLTQAGGNCGVWQARPGNSGNPPDTIGTDIAIIVTNRVNKQGPNIGGIIEQIVIVHRDAKYGDKYAGNPGHPGWGIITSIPCTSPQV